MKTEAIGAVYVIRFSNGTVKVGKTTDPRNRIGNHSAIARVHGNPVVEYWVSDLHECYATTETLLIDKCTAAVSPTAGNEWFSGLSYDVVVEWAKTLVVLSDKDERRKAVQAALKLLEMNRELSLELTGEDDASDVGSYFYIEPGTVLRSAEAFSLYQDAGGSLLQKTFKEALVAFGAEHKRTKFGSVFTDVNFLDQR